METGAGKIRYSHLIWHTKTSMKCKEGKETAGEIFEYHLLRLRNTNSKIVLSLYQAFCLTVFTKSLFWLGIVKSMHTKNLNCYKKLNLNCFNDAQIQQNILQNNYLKMWLAPFCTILHHFAVVSVPWGWSICFRWGNNAMRLSLALGHFSAAESGKGTQSMWARLLLRTRCEPQVGPMRNSQPTDKNERMGVVWTVWTVYITQSLVIRRRKDKLVPAKLTSIPLQPVR